LDVKVIEQKCTEFMALKKNCSVLFTTYTVYSCTGSYVHCYLALVVVYTVSAVARDAKCAVTVTVVMLPHDTLLHYDVCLKPFSGVVYE
jgi:hypothetical protein